MDLNFLREPALMLFSSAMMWEAYVTATMFFAKDKLPIGAVLKWSTVLAFVGFSGVNLYAFVEVYLNTALTEPLITKMLYCFFGMLVMLCIYLLKRAIIRELHGQEA